MSAGYKLLDFIDIYTAVCEELKVPITDGTTLGRIKRDINIVYINQVMTYKPRAWWWAEQKQDITTYAKIETGTIAVTVDSTTITFSSAPAVSVAGYYLKLDGFPDIIKISTHTAASDTAVLEKAWVNDAATASSYKVWKDYVAISSTMKEIVAVTHDRLSTPMEALHNSKFTEIRARRPEYSGYPTMYNTGDFDSDGSRIIKWYPACSADRFILHIEGRQEATALSADADEPLMPVEDRIVLLYGALARAWSRERNESEAGKNFNLFQNKLREMAGKSGDAPQTTEMSTDPDYLIRKRYRRYSTNGGRFESE